MKQFNLILSEQERVELMKVIDCGVRAQGLNLNLAVVHNLCAKITNAAEYVPLDEPKIEDKKDEDEEVAA